MLAAGFSRDERYAGKSVGEKVRTVADPCMAVFGFRPWIVGGALMSPVQAGQLMMVRRAFVIRWSELQSAMGPNCAPSERGDLRCVGAHVRACLPSAPRLIPISQ